MESNLPFHTAEIRPYRGIDLISTTVFTPSPPPSPLSFLSMFFMFWGKTRISFRSLVAFRAWFSLSFFSYEYLSFQVRHEFGSKMGAGYVWRGFSAKFLLVILYGYDGWVSYAPVILSHVLYRLCY